MNNYPKNRKSVSIADKKKKSLSMLSSQKVKVAHQSSVFKQKMRESQLGDKNRMRNPETRLKMTLTRRSQDFRGENSPSWKGGKNSIEYKEKILGRKKTEQCEICGSLGKICLDHDHKTGKLRGWICSRCNLALGLIKDNRETLLAMVDYLNNNQEVN